MKTIIKSGLVLLLSILFFASCKNDEFVSSFTDIKFKDLPQSAQSFTTENFEGIDVLSIKKKDEASVNGLLYKMTLDKGYFVDFNAAGEWLAIGGSQEPIPNSIFTGTALVAIKEYIVANFETDTVAAIEKKSNAGYQVDLHSGKQLSFDKDGVFVK